MKLRFNLLWTVVTWLAAAVSVTAQTPNITALQRSAEAGDAKAQFDLADTYFEGNGVPKDPHEAAKWYRKAARQSDKDPKHAQKAQSDLGVMAAQGTISIDEADWQAPEPGSEPTQQAKAPQGKSTDGKTTNGKTSDGKITPAKSKASPFSLAEVETGLTGGITPKRMTTLVGQYGVDFSLNASAKQRLTSEGADDGLLQTIASSKR